MENKIFDLVEEYHRWKERWEAVERGGCKVVQEGQILARLAQKGCVHEENRPESFQPHPSESLCLTPISNFLNLKKFSHATHRTPRLLPFSCNNISV